MDPEHDLIALSHELYKFQGLLQFGSLLLQFRQQQLPQSV